MGEAGPLTYIESGFSGNNTTFKVRVISMESSNEIKIMSEDFAKVPPAKLSNAYELICDLNSKYRFAKFTIDKNGGICAQWDMVDNIPFVAIGKVAIEIVLRMWNIIDDAYPEIMKMLWA